MEQQIQTKSNKLAPVISKNSCLLILSFSFLTNNHISEVKLKFFQKKKIEFRQEGQFLKQVYEVTRRQ